MSEKPIIFSTEMVKAILNGRKTQTRRVIKPQPPQYCAPLIGPEWYEPFVVDRYGEYKEGKPIFGIYDDDGEFGAKCPWQPGDTLWVRETWLKNAPGGVSKYFHKADAPDEVIGQAKAFGYRWRSSRYMPREAARIFLNVKSIRVEQVQDITEDDARAEGWPCNSELFPAINTADKVMAWFKRLWDSINAKPRPIYIDGEILSYVSYPWDAIRETRTYRGKPWIVSGNPWVFVISFERREVATSG